MTLSVTSLIASATAMVCAIAEDAVIDLFIENLPCLCHCYSCTLLVHCDVKILVIDQVADGRYA